MIWLIFIFSFQLSGKPLLGDCNEFFSTKRQQSKALVTEDEIGAIRKYTGGASYREINIYLESSHFLKKSKWNADIHSIDSLLSKIVSEKRTVYRSIEAHFSDDKSFNIFKRYPIGKKFTEKRYLSTTLIPEGSGDHLTTTHIFEIQAQNAKNIMMFSFRDSSEQEYLIPRDTQFEVLSIEGKFIKQGEDEGNWKDYRLYQKEIFEKIIANNREIFSNYTNAQINKYLSKDTGWAPIFYIKIREINSYIESKKIHFSKNFIKAVDATDFKQASRIVSNKWRFTNNVPKATSENKILWQRYFNGYEFLQFNLREIGLKEEFKYIINLFYFFMMNRSFEIGQWDAHHFAQLDLDFALTKLGKSANEVDAYKKIIMYAKNKKMGEADKKDFYDATKLLALKPEMAFRISYFLDRVNWFDLEDFKKFKSKNKKDFQF